MTRDTTHIDRARRIKRRISRRLRRSPLHASSAVASIALSYACKHLEDYAEALQVTVKALPVATGTRHLLSVYMATLPPANIDALALQLVSHVARHDMTEDPLTLRYSWQFCAVFSALEMTDQTEDFKTAIHADLKRTR